MGGEEDLPDLDGADDVRISGRLSNSTRKQIEIANLTFLFYSPFRMTLQIAMMRVSQSSIWQLSFVANNLTFSFPFGFRNARLGVEDLETVRMENRRTVDERNLDKCVSLN